MTDYLGTDGDDTIKGSGRDDIITGLGGSDLIKAGAGDDIVYAGEGDNTVDGGSGADYITAGSGNDSIDGGAHNDTIDAGDGNNYVDGGSHNDLITTGSGDDTIDGGSHNDTISSGGGKDYVLGGSGNDSIDAGGGKDTVDGGSGNDTINGGGGNDELHGSSGSDSIMGGNGDDTIWGDSGNDTIDGGNGADMLKFNAGSDNDTVNNFNVADGDQICFEGLNPGAMSLSHSDGNTIISFVDGPQITITGVDLSLDPGMGTAFHQGFETDTSGWLDEDDSWYGQVTRVPSGTNGITASEGSNFAIFTQSGPVGDESGPYTQFDHFRDSWTGTITAQADIYLDTNMAAGEGFDYSVAANGTDGNHQRDFIFHVTKDTSTGELLVAADNNTNFAPREDLESLANHYQVTASGWFTFEQVLRDNGGQLAVDLNLYDSGHNLVFTETRTDPSDTIPAEVGGNRYGWFTNIDVTGGVAVDNVNLITQDVAPSWFCFT